jgi:Rieske Fe-S protein
MDEVTRKHEVHDRRTFCRCIVSITALGGTVPILLEGCSSSNPGSSIPGSPLPTIAGTVLNGVVLVPVASGSALASTGGMALITSSAGSFLATRTDASTFVVLTAICTHQTCVISSYSGQTFVCPCHGSEFDTSGRVTQGPAIAALRRFSAQFSNDTLMIS